MVALTHEKYEALEPAMVYYTIAQTKMFPIQEVSMRYRKLTVVLQNPPCSLLLTRIDGGHERLPPLCPRPHDAFSLRPCRVSCRCPILILAR